MSPRILAMIIGGCCIAVGVILFLLNVSGVTNLTVEAGLVKGSLAKATPGAFLVFVGMVIILVALFRQEETTKVEYRGPGGHYSHVKIVRRIKKVEPAEALKLINEQIGALEDLKREIEKQIRAES